VEGPAAPIRQQLPRNVTALPFVISTGAKRSGEICGCLGLNKLELFKVEHPERMLTFEQR
jgi:hypothetical protein